MPKAYDIKKRSIQLGGKGNSVTMEWVYWASIDALAIKQGTPWRVVVKSLVSSRPPDYKGSRIAWIRYAAMQLFVNGTTRRSADITTDAVASRTTLQGQGVHPS